MRCTYRPEPGRHPAQDCWTIFLTEEALTSHVKQFHPSHREWAEPAVQGTPVVTLGFTHQELDAMEAVAWPSSVETWIHEQVAVALALAP